MTTQPDALPRHLGVIHLWSIAVGLVISGEYFGWSYGWASAGTLGFLVATLAVALMYLSLIFSYTELTTAMPRAGGPFVYVTAAFGRRAGLIAGIASVMEFVFAPPAIALAIGAYLHVQYPWLSPTMAAAGAFCAFMALNIAGVHLAARFELFVTVAAIIELLIFMVVVWPGFSMARFTDGGWAGSGQVSLAAFGGIARSVPFAIWFFLAIEGVALTAEEARDPHRTLPLAYVASIFTLVALALGVMVLAGGVGDWRALADRNDPLPQAMRIVVGPHSGYVHMLVWLGLFGLIASLHGIIMGYSRQIYALARDGGLPRLLAHRHPRLGTPWVATLAGGAIGIIAILCDDFASFGGQSLTASLVTLSVFGALIVYVLTMASLFRLRRRDGSAHLVWKVPGFPYVPAFALLAASGALVLMGVFHPVALGIAVLFVGGAIALPGAENGRATGDSF
ncbi:ethanolamine permease [Gluconacetobacter takamatsuzukensis]|uniref:Ethanolamine permease n=1 Tax=Gluconacetobacter takamatsuzukensis TaxID=1286190 RepID=A0A7W4KBP8_9PROT|nr:ethanolamine permease [Gluconacetobacter takamatsuzukensis]MBB2203915.1 ethanolamine permease [Gluconacetobacter takamatsuzukensis]